MKRTILHIGANKAGSSALQAGCARYRDQLLRAGVYYPTHPGIERAASGRFTSGNGDHIRAYLVTRFRHGDFSERNFFDKLRKQLEASPVPTVLFSNEGLHNADPGKLEELRAFLQNHSEVVDVYYYVRHILDHALSCYVQNVKMGREVRPLPDFLTEYRSPFLRNCEKFHMAFGPSFHVEVYERHKADLFAQFLEWVGCALEGSCEVELVNRSPTADEVTLLRAVNRLHIPESARAKIAAHVTETRGPEVQRVAVDRQAFLVFQERHDHELKRLNHRFVPEFALKLKSDSVVVGASDSDPLTDREKILVGWMRIIAEALEKESN